MEDVPDLVEMLERLHRQKKPGYAFEPHDAERYMRTAIKDAVVIRGDSSFLAGAFAPSPANARWLTAYEIFWWAEDGQGLGLLRTFEDMARQAACSEIVVSYPANETRVSRVLERGGYSANGEAMRKLLCA